MSKGMLGKLRLSEVWRLVGDLFEKLGGEDGKQWLKALKKFLRKENPWAQDAGGEQAIQLSLEQRPVWRTLQHVHQNVAVCKIAFGPAGYRAILREAGCRISNGAADIIKKPAFQQGFDIDNVELLIATTKKLTGKNRATTAEVFAAIQRADELCPAWVGPELRQQYPDQPHDEQLFIAMETITDSDGNSVVFCVERDGYERGRWLRTSHGHPDRVWSGVDRWVFCRRLQQQL